MRLKQHTRIAVLAILLAAVMSIAASSIARADWHWHPIPAPTLTANGETLSWNRVSWDNRYEVLRNLPGERSEVFFVYGTTVVAEGRPCHKLGYRVRSILWGSSWSNEVFVKYPCRHHKEKSEETTEEREQREQHEKEQAEQKKHEEEQKSKEAKEKREKEELEQKEKHELEEKESKEKQEKEQEEKEKPKEEKSGGAKIPSQPDGPTGQWSVAYGDAFGTPIGIGSGQDNTWQPTNKNDGCCNNSDEISVVRPEKVATGENGLTLTCTKLKEPIAGKPFECGNLAGALCCQVNSKQEPGYNSPVISWKGESLVFQFRGKLPPNQSNSADSGWWADGPPWNSAEFDFFELWGWGCGPGWSGCNGTYGTWFAPPHPQLEKFGWSSPNPTQEHTWTTEVKSVGGGKYKFRSWIDGELLPGEREATPSPEARLDLELTFTEREPTSSNFQGSEAETVRYVGVWIDSAHKGVGVENEGLAPGTSVG